MKIRWIGQSGYILTDKKTTIYIDPYLSDVVNRVAGRERMVETPVMPKNVETDMIICTHNHLDHLDTDAIAQMNKDKILFLAPKDCENALDNLGVKKYQPFDIGDSLKVGGFELSAVYANHTVPAIGVLVEYDGIRMYFTGDTYYDEKLTEVECDILFVCINGKLGNMNVGEAVVLTKKLKPKLGIPNHYGMFGSNTENPLKYTDNVECGFIMDFDREYEIKELIK